MQKKNAEQTLISTIHTLTRYLYDLQEIKDTPHDQFAYGEKTAYVECLEMLLRWEKSETYGLDFDVETRFPL